MWRRPFLIAFLSTLIALPAWAFERPFPQNTKRDTMSPAAYPELLVDGKLRRLAPGARIWNQDNLIQMPTSITGQDLPVNYTEDAQGDINRVWILNEKEASQPLASQINSQSQ